MRLPSVTQVGVRDRRGMHAVTALSHAA